MEKKKDNIAPMWPIYMVQFDSLRQFEKIKIEKCWPWD